MNTGAGQTADEPDAVTSTRWLVDRVLDGLNYPAQKWQLLAQADLNGVDGITRERLWSLPVRGYRHSAEVAWALDAMAADPPNLPAPRPDADVYAATAPDRYPHSRR